MATIDAKLELSDNQAFTSVAAHVSTNIIKLAAADLAIGAGTPLYLNVRVNGAQNVDSAGAATVAVSLESDNVKSFDSRTQIYTTPALALASLTAGAWILRMPLPPELLEQWIGIVYTVGTAVLTQGAFDAWIGISPSILHP